MITFKTFISEGKFPVWLRMTTAAAVLKIRNLDLQIRNEDDPVKQNRLIAQQNKLQSYITGLAVGVGSTDTALLKRLKGGMRS
jgi:hypothetical protein